MSQTKRMTMNRKPVFSVPAKTIINFKSKFDEKLLCDGLTFSTGSACAYSCTFCYVEGMLARGAHVKEIRAEGIPFENAVIRRDGALEALSKQLLNEKGQPKYKHSQDQRVIFASPLVDVAANMDLVRETAAACSLILEHTNWTIRLLSKSNLLPQLARLISGKWKQRIIYGVSTGTLDDRLTQAFEVGTPLVSRRIESLHELQDEGYRTFGMICPSLPQVDYEQFASEMAEAIRVDRCEHVWAEVINLRGKSFTRTIAALNVAGLVTEAKLLEDSHIGDAWEAYARETFQAHQKFISASKLRFMQYVKKSTVDWWSQYADRGALLLGAKASAVKKPTQIRPAVISEVERFETLNAIVTRAAMSFVDAGLALYDIRADKLYRHKYSTFEAYCQGVHAISRQYANSLIRAGRITRDLETIVSKDGLPLPQNEAQVRELVRLPNPKERAIVYREALDAVGRDIYQLTASSIREKVDHRMHSRAPKKKAKSSKMQQAVMGIVEEIEAINHNEEVQVLLEKLKAQLT